MLGIGNLIDVAPDTMRLRMAKSPSEIALIKEGGPLSRTLEAGRSRRRSARVSARSMSQWPGETRWETAIADAFPDAEYRDTWVWFQSGSTLMVRITLSPDGGLKPAIS